MTMAQNFSEFITHPISVMQIKTIEVDDEGDIDEFEDKPQDDLDVDDEDDVDDPEVKAKKEITTKSRERVNTQKVIWTRSKDEITDEEYQGFYKTIAKGKSDTAASWSYFDADGNINLCLFLSTRGKRANENYGEYQGACNTLCAQVPYLGWIFFVISVSFIHQRSSRL